MKGRGFIGVSDLPTSAGMLSMMKSVYREEGFRGFYRGYFAYIFAIVFWAAALPAATNSMLNVYPYL